MKAILLLFLALLPGLLLAGCGDNTTPVDESSVLPQEICNGRDDDQDSLIDEEWFEQKGQPCLITLDQASIPGNYQCSPDGTGLICVADQLIPPASERCDGLDNNWNGQVDEGFDQDGDGYTTCGSHIGPDGQLIEGPRQDLADCDDNDSAKIFKLSDCNDPETDTIIIRGVDRDLDGFGSEDDCDDLDPAIHPLLVCDEASGGDFDAIQKALYFMSKDLGNPCRVILVCPGRYLENLDLLESGNIKLKSTHGPRKTIIDGSRLARPVITNIFSNVNSLMTGEILIEGFTLKYGVAPFYYSNDDKTMLILTLISGGAGITMMTKQASYIERVVIRNNIIELNNTSLYFGRAGTGGAISLSNVQTSIIENNIIRYNHCTPLPGFACNGGGIYVDSDQGQAYLINNLIYSNLTDAAASSGGGIYLSIPEGFLSYNTIVGNQAGNGAGLALAYARNSTLILNYHQLNRNIIALNSGVTGFYAGNAVKLSGADNLIADPRNKDSAQGLSYCNPSENNCSPNFVDDCDQDLSGKRCLPDLHLTSVGIATDIVKYETESSQLFRMDQPINYDLDGNPRPYNGFFDVGCYEYTPTAKTEEE